MSTNSIVLSVVMEAVPGREQDLAAQLKRLVGPTRSEPGCLGYELNISTERPGTFLFNEKFADEAALEAHIKTAHFQSFQNYREKNDPVANQIVTRWSPIA
jgi:quinol monooxygenase YgiN